MRHTFIFILILALAASCRKDNNTQAGAAEMRAKIFVANENGSTIQAVDVNQPESNVTIDLDDHTGDMLMPHNVQVAPDGKSVWVTIHPMLFNALDQVAIIDPVSLQIKKRIYIGEDYHLAHVVLNDAGTNAFVTATDSDQVVMIDAVNYNVVKFFELPDGSEPHGMRYFKGRLYVACMGAKCLSIIDVASGNISSVPLGGVAVQAAITADGKYVFVSLYDTRELARYDIQTGQVNKLSLPSGAQGPIQLYCTPNSKSVLVCDQGKLNGMPVSNKVYEVDIASFSVTQTIQVGNAAHGIVISKDGKKAFVTNSDDNTVSVIDLKTKTVVRTIPVGVDPNGISYWYESGGMP